ncbi:unnamed protein product [Allacma fusca]|uniref:Glycine-rich protein n=1 Tax=Allacma fusca TaxID=39272 RepID=A0A8J2LGE1_9HEXA|nr:unnamed protein product [Allacma fusca]
MKPAIILAFFAILALAHSSDPSDLEKAASEGNSELPGVKALDNASPDKESDTADLDSASSFFVGIGGFGGGWGRGYGGYGGGYGGGWGRRYGGYGGGYGGGWGRRRGWGWGK